MPTAPPEPAPSAEPFPVGLVDRLRRPESRIFARVAARRERLRAVLGLEGEALRAALVDELVSGHALLSMGSNALFALPVPLPLLGPWGGLAATVAGSVAVDLVLQIELVYALAAAHGSPLRGEELRREAWRLVGLGSREDLGRKAWAIGQRVTVKKLAQKALVQGVARAFCALAAPGRPGPARGSLETAVGLAAVPVVAGLAARDMRQLAARTCASLACNPSETDPRESERSEA